MDIYFLEQETRARIADLRRYASHDRLVLLAAEGGRGRHRRLSLAARLAAALRFDALRHAAFLFPRGRLPAGGR